MLWKGLGSHGFCFIRKWSHHPTSDFTELLQCKTPFHCWLTRLWAARSCQTAPEHIKYPAIQWSSDMTFRGRVFLLNGWTLSILNWALNVMNVLHRFLSCREGHLTFSLSVTLHLPTHLLFLDCLQAYWWKRCTNNGNRNIQKSRSEIRTRTPCFTSFFFIWPVPLANALLQHGWCFKYNQTWTPADCPS